MKRRILLALVVGSAFVSGCASYYKVTDPNTQAVYYTNNLQRQQSGVVVLKDARTGQEVTLPASRVEKITKEQYDVGRYGAATPASAKQ